MENYRIVSAYGHANGPGEDFAESFTYYVENVNKLKTVSMGNMSL